MTVTPFYYESERQKHKRFLNASVDKYDNWQYIRNIAGWLEENNSLSVNRSILIYNTFNKSVSDKFKFNGLALEVLEKKNGSK